jgi:acyl dehydratase
LIKESSILGILKMQIGQEMTYTDEFEVEKGMIQRFAIAVGDSNPIYFEEEFARKTIYKGMIAPFTFLFEWNHHSHSILSPEKRRSLFKDLKSQPRVLRGVNEYNIIQPVRPGDIITSKSRLSEAYEKQGKSGLLIFAVCENIYYNQKQEVLGKSRDTYILLP